MINVIGGVVGGVGGAIGDAVRRVTAGLPGGAAQFRVEPDRIFHLANEFDAVATRIEQTIAAEGWNLTTAPPGADKPSRDAALRLRETASGDMGVLPRLVAYAASLRQAAIALRQTGQQYGLTDTTEGGRLGAGNL